MADPTTQEQIDAAIDDRLDGVAGVDYGDRKVQFVDPDKHLDFLDRVARRRSTRRPVYCGFAEPGKGF